MAEMADFGGYVMHNCYAIGRFPSIYEDGGRGGIRTHGGFPHARFRVECLKPGSATLPSLKNPTLRKESRLISDTPSPLQRARQRVQGSDFRGSDSNFRGRKPEP
jgi:hypothetical protein